MENYLLKKTITGEKNIMEEHKDNVDYFITEDDIRFAGRHLLVDIWTDHYLDNKEKIAEILTKSALAGGATILYSHFHHFEPNFGVSGVLVLAESHISIHSWPEERYAAIDIFMCGHANPDISASVIQEEFMVEKATIERHRRGIGEKHGH